jgi:seryl-tRNA synthetase
MAGQDAELEVMRARVCELEEELKTQAEKHADGVVQESRWRAAAEDAEARATAADEKAANATAQLADALAKQSTSPTPPTPPAPPTPRSVEVQTCGTDTYIDTAQLSKATQTDAEEAQREPHSVAEAAKQTYIAFERFAALAQCAPSTYHAQCGTHPPPRRFSLQTAPGKK